MADLIQRLRDHAARHAEISRFSDEQAQWGRDLLEAAELLEQGAAVQPTAERHALDELHKLDQEIFAAPPSDQPTAEPPLKEDWRRGDGEYWHIWYCVDCARSKSTVAKVGHSLTCIYSTADNGSSG